MIPLDGIALLKHQRWFVWVTVLVVIRHIALRLRCYYVRQTFLRDTKCQNPPCYPHQDWIWGSDLIRERMVAMKEGRFFRLYLAHFEMYGKTFQDKIRGHRTINTMEARNVQQVLALKTEDYVKDSARVRAAAPFLGPSVFSDGPDWKRSRMMVNPIFVRAELSDTDRLALFTEKFMNMLPGDGTMIDIQPLLKRLFLDVSADFILGESVGGLQARVPARTSEFFSAFAEAQRWVTKRREAGWMSIRYDYCKEWMESYQTVHSFIDRNVERVLSEIEHDTIDKERGPNNPEGRKRYVLLTELAKHMRDPVALRYQVLGILLPAHDTTARAVGNALFQLARNPCEWTKLRSMVKNIGQEPLTLEKLRSLVEFKRVILETIRTVGPVARIVREAIRDTVLPVGGGTDGKAPCFVPKGTTVSMSTWSMCHDRDVWGDDVEAFKPDRWIGRKTYWEFVPFSGGPRICPAQQQVIMHTTYLLVKLVQRFESIENCDPVKDYVERFTLGPESKNGIKVAFHECS